jgi:hypothetical protein
MARLSDYPVKPAVPRGCIGGFIIGLLLTILLLAAIFTALR